MESSLMNLLEKSSLPNSKPLPLKFYLQDTVTVATELLGKGLFVQSGKNTYLSEIVEVEAYLGKSDPASHSHRGMTERNRSMFEVGGTAYVYLIYGFYHCVNVVTESKGVGAAVLIRAAKPLWGLKQMQKNRKLSGSMQADKLLSGPGKITQALKIDRRFDGLTFDRPDFKIIDLGNVLRDSQIGSSSRIGISKAQNKLLRFFVKGSPWLSRKQP